MVVAPHTDRAGFKLFDKIALMSDEEDAVFSFILLDFSTLIGTRIIPFPGHGPGPLRPCFELRACF